MPTALVTGAAGFIGSHLVEGLLDRGYRVRGLDNLTTGTRGNLAGVWEHSDFAFVEGDVRDEAAVERAVKGVEVVFHLAAYTSVPGSFTYPELATDVNCTGTATVFEVARESDVERVVFISSAAVYGSDVPVPVDETAHLSPESPYALSKRYGEQLAVQLGEVSGLDTVSLRFFNVYGPRQDPSGAYAAVIPAFIERLRSGKPPVIYGDGEQSRDFVYVTDVVDAVIRAGEYEYSGEVLNVGGGRRVTINELATTLVSIIESDADETDSAVDARKADTEQSGPRRSNLEPVHEPPREGDIRHSQADISRAHEVLEYEPRVSLAEGLERTVEAFQSS